MTILFDNDDAAYLRWLAEHPDGFVVNMRRRHDPTYLILHRAGCKSINLCGNAEEAPGGFTERAYRKLCATSVTALEEGLRQLIGTSTSFSKECSLCRPR